MVCALAGCAANGDSIRDSLPHIDGQELSAAAGSCEEALLDAGRAARTADMGGPRMARLPLIAAERDAWLDAAAACPERFGEMTMRAALAGHTIDVEASMGSMDALTAVATGGESAPDAKAFAPVDGVSAEAAAVIALAEDRAGFGYEVIAARGERDDADVAASEHHRRVASLWAAKADKDPRLKVYQPSGLTDGSGTAKVGAVTTNERAAVAMDAALEEIKGLTADVLEGSGTEASGRLASVIAANAAEAFRQGYPAQEWTVLG